MNPDLLETIGIAAGSFSTGLYVGIQAHKWYMRKIITKEIEPFLDPEDKQRINQYKTKQKNSLEGKIDKK